MFFMVNDTIHYNTIVIIVKRDDKAKYATVGIFGTQMLTNVTYQQHATGDNVKTSK